MTTRNVRYKDQVRDASVLIVRAVAVGESQLADESLQRRLGTDAHQQLVRQETKDKRKATMMVLGGVALLLLTSAAIVVGGVCGSGKCSGSSFIEQSDFSSSASVPTTSTPTIALTQSPTGSPRSITTSDPVKQPSTLLRPESIINFIVNYINGVTLSGHTLTYPNSQVLAEEQAVTWLIEDDIGTSTTDGLKLRQRFALATLWFANGPLDSDHLGNWLTSTDECEWESIVACVDGEVTDVDFGVDGLNGQLPSDLGLLTNMTVLIMRENRLTGSIPTQVGLLTSLSLLYMWGNLFTGTIPVEIESLSHLTGLNLWGNKLTGSIPSEIGLLTGLRVLSLDVNQLTGTIPTELNQLTELTIFWIFGNNVSGSMPFCDNATRPAQFTDLEADCDKVSCPCCTACCPAGGFEGIPSANFCGA